MFLFLSCNLINKSHIQILIVICTIHQFYLHFAHGGVRLIGSPSLTGDLS